MLKIFESEYRFCLILCENEIEHILEHEQAHIKRLDYLWKPIGFIVLSVHFINPIVGLYTFSFAKTLSFLAMRK